MRKNWYLLLTAGALAGCNAFSEPTPPDRVSPPPAVVVPTDERAPLRAETPPPPISGGTLAIASSLGYAVAADPDRDRISVVELATGQVDHIALQPGDEPGRVVTGPGAVAYVALRRGGAVVTIDLLEHSLIERRAACPAPRGIALDAGPGRQAQDCEGAADGLGGVCSGTADIEPRLVVACAGGEVVTLPPAGGSAELIARLQPGLRDVLVDDGTLRVTNFKQAALITLDADGQPIADARPNRTPRTRLEFLEDGEVRVSDSEMAPHLAWRTVQGPGGAVMLHQQADEGMIALPDPHTQTGAQTGAQGDEAEGAGEIVGAAGGGGPPPPPPGIFGGGGGSAYGGDGSGCGGIVHTSLTRLDAHGEVTSSGTLAGATLAVDVAAGPDSMFAVAVAGRRDTGAPVRAFAGEATEAGAPAPAPFDPAFGGETSSVIVTTLNDFNTAFPGECRFSEAHLVVEGQATAVAFTDDGRLVVQTREPAALHVGRITDPGLAQLALGGRSVADTGHDLFHRDTGAGIACASCHGEGGDDGHVWHFDTIGRRRTQAMHIGLEGTAPFHWDGDMADIDTLMEEVFVGRMGGVHQSEARLSTLQDWVFQLRPAAPVRAFDDADPQVMRGRALFESDEVGCASCHSGAKFTSSKSFDVGTGAEGPLQVPSLVGIAYRAPFMHDGCAATLRDRFDPTCGGGDAHGTTSGLTDTDIDALVAYLETL